MALIDFIILIPLLWGAYQGFRKGLVMELVTILAFILGITIGFMFMDWGIDLLKPHISDESIVPYISFLLIFGLVLFGVISLGKVVKRIVKVTMMGFADRAGGVIFGLLKWAFALSILLWLSEKAGVQIPDNMTEGSLIYPKLLSYGPFIIDTVASIFPLDTELATSISNSVQG